ncbi:MAG: sugar ABC transporter ATP-binding protein [bacterium]|nr:sugar ABC transporter ATP-binding protein [bacterium]
MREICKRFPGVDALVDVDFDVRAGEVHALMGENGAGKSTLIKVLTGVHRSEGGSMHFRGQPFQAATPADAQAHGIHTVYQEINVVGSLSVAENLFAGRFPQRWFGIDWQRMRQRSCELLARFDLHLDVDEPLGGFPVAIQQMVAIIRAVDIDARLLILDEPTSSLDRHEIDILFDTIGRLKDQGIGVVFITHFLDEVYRISDRITVLRNGHRVGTFATAALSRVELVGHMLGHPAPSPVAAGAASAGAVAPAAGDRLTPVLRARGLSRRGAIEPFDLHVARGEVLGMAGLLGSGRTEAARLLFGADRADRGSVEVRGRRIPHHRPRQALRYGLALCPEDRHGSGIIPDMSVRENIALAACAAGRAEHRPSRFGIVSRRAQLRLAEGFVHRLGIATPDLDRPVRYLSGGNQQKVILARWLATQPVVLILDEPTRGIDVGAKAEVERLVEQLAADGMAILFISSELEEVLRRSHRVLVLRDRRVIGELAGEDIDMAQVMNAIAAPESQEEAPAAQSPSAGSAPPEEVREPGSRQANRSDAP